jgi:hypothetical protein
MSLTVTTRLRRLPRLDCPAWNVLRSALVFRMPGLMSHALKHPHLLACLPDKLLATSLRCRPYSKSTTASAVSKPTTTKKKYSELPALHPPCEYPSSAVLSSQTTSNNHDAHYPHVPECASFSPERLRLSVNMVGCFSIIHSWDFELVFDFIPAVAAI